LLNGKTTPEGEATIIDIAFMLFNRITYCMFNQNETGPKGNRVAILIEA
jgi:hypothetical protein